MFETNEKQWAEKYKTSARQQKTNKKEHDKFRIKKKYNYSNQMKGSAIEWKEERILELENRAVEMIQSEQEREDGHKIVNIISET